MTSNFMTEEEKREMKKHKTCPDFFLFKKKGAPTKKQEILSAIVP